MFHVKPRQVQPGALVPRRTDDAPGVRSIGQHFRRVARRTVAAPQSVSRAAAALVAQAGAVLARRARCPATRDSAPLARTPPAGTSLAMRLPVNASKARAASAKAALAVVVAVAVVAVVARNQASRQAQVPVPRARPANAVPADADRLTPTRAQPPVPCLLGQNLIPPCPAVPFLVDRYYSSARYPATRRLADRSRAGRGLVAGRLARCRPGRCRAARIPALRSAGRASNPASTARIPAAARAQPNWIAPVPHSSASPFPASPQRSALWMGRPEMTCLRKGLPPPGLPMAAGPRTASLKPTDAKTSGPGTAGRATTAVAVTHHPRTADRGTTDPGATGPGTTGPWTIGPGMARAGTTDPAAVHPGSTDPRAAHPGTTRLEATGSGATDPGAARPEATGLAAAHPGIAGSGMTDLERTVRKPAPGDLIPAGRLRVGPPAATSPGPWRRAQVASSRMALARTALSQLKPLRSVASEPGYRLQARHPPECGCRLPRAAPH